MGFKFIPKLAPILMYESKVSAYPLSSTKESDLMFVMSSILRMNTYTFLTAFSWF